MDRQPKFTTQDFMSNSTHHRIFAIAQLGLSHIDGALMVRNHQGCKIMVNLSVHRS